MLCDLQIFSGGVYPPSATSRTISFLFPIVFGINISYLQKKSIMYIKHTCLFWGRGEGVQKK